jgi:hypothetical protein
LCTGEEENCCKYLLFYILDEEYLYFWDWGQGGGANWMVGSEIGGTHRYRKFSGTNKYTETGTWYQ